MIALTTTILVPAGTSRVHPSTSTPFSALGEEGVERADRERADDRAPEARRASDDEHRERDEREIEVDSVDVDREEVDVEPASEPRQEAGERERAEPLPVDRDTHGPGGRRILTRRA